MTGPKPARSITVTFGRGIDAHTRERVLQAVVAASGGARVTSLRKTRRIV